MPPRRKRKAEEATGNNDDDVKPAPKKKSKAEQKAEAKARAKAWHEKRNSKSPVPASKSSTPYFSAGKKSPPPSKKKATKRRTTPSRSTRSSPSRSASRSTKTSSARKTRDTSFTATDFKFEPPVLKTEVKAEEKDEEEEMAIDLTEEEEEKKPAAKRTRGKDSDEELDEDAEEAKSAKKSKQEEGRARIAALREQREKKGLKVTSPGKSPRTKVHSLDPPVGTTKSVSDPSKCPLNRSRQGSTNQSSAMLSIGKKPSSPHRPEKCFNPSEPRFNPSEPKSMSGQLSTAPTSFTSRQEMYLDANVGMSLDQSDSNGKTDPPHQLDDKVAAKPSPPGDKYEGINEAKSTRENKQSGPPQVEAPVANREFLSVAFSRARASAHALVSSAVVANAQRKERLGTAVFGKQTSTAAVETEAGPIDPPTNPAVSATLRKFRDVSSLSEASKAEDKEADIATSDSPTVAGENTSETGDNSKLDGNPSATASELTYESPKRTSRFMGCCLTFLKIVMGLQIVYFLLAALTGNINTDLDKSKSLGESAIQEVKLLDCFIDYPPNYEQSGEDLDDACEGQYVQCPNPWGHCRGGKLLDCNDGGGEMFGMTRFDVNKNGDACIPSDKAVGLAVIVKEALAAMSVSETCGSGVGSDNLRQVEPYPLFSLDKVADHIKASRAEDQLSDMTISADLLLWLYPSLDTKVVTFGSVSGSDEDDLDALGLGPGVPPNSLILPMKCKLKLMMWELLEFFLWFSISLTSWIWNFSRHHPYSSVGVAVFTKCTLIFQRKRKHRRKVNELFEIVKEQVHDLLAEENEGVPMLHLRDEVVRTMYSNPKDRQFVNKFVFPMVMNDVRTDNRIRKFRKTVGQKDMEHWELSKLSVRARKKRMGTPNSSATATEESTAPVDP